MVALYLELLPGFKAALDNRMLVPCGIIKALRFISFSIAHHTIAEGRKVLILPRLHI